MGDFPFRADMGDAALLNIAGLFRMGERGRRIVLLPMRPDDFGGVNFFLGVTCLFGEDDVA